MEILGLIEFFDQSGEIIVTRIPYEGSADLKLGTHLIVQESQEAFFFRNGQALDSFTAGKHVLTTQNIPLLGKLVGSTFGGKSPFSAYVYFVSTTTFTNLGWGTQSPVVFRDTDFKMISLRAHGSFSIRISKPRVFLNTLVGTRGIETTYALENFIRGIIISRLNEVLGSVMTSILDLPIIYNEISIKIKDAVFDDLGQYGIQLVDLFIEAITPPTDVQDMINRASGIAVQDTEKYKNIAMSDAMLASSQNTSGGMGEGMGAGMGMGMGISMAQQMTQSMAPKENNSSIDSSNMTMAEIKKKLEELREMKEVGLISDDEFSDLKAKIFTQI